MAEGDKDWVYYASELERIFAEEADPRVLARKRELSALLKSKDQTNDVAAYLKKYSLKKLKNDLNMFIDERRATFKTVFLDQLSRDFLDSNGTPFLEALGDMEKSGELDPRAKQAHLNPANVVSLQTNQDIDLQRVGHESRNGHDMTETGGQGIVLGTAAVSDKKSPRRMILPTRDSSDDVSQEVQNCNVASKQSKTPTSVSLAVPSKEGMPLSRNFGLEVMRSCSPHLSVSIEGEKIHQTRKPSRTNKNVTISGVESDADTQVVERLNIDDEKCEGEGYRKEGAQSPSHSESGSDRRHFQKTVATQVVRRKTTGLPSERRTLEPDRKRASTCSPEAKIAERRDNEKSVIKNESLPLDAEEIYEVDYLDIGDDGQEEICHKCGLDGDLTCCDRCPISMHLKCIEVLGLRVPKSNEDWCCPICVAVKASQGAREAAKMISL